MTFRVGNNRVRVDIEHLLFLAALLGYCGWYLWDTRQASTSFQNLLLIQPAVILCFLLGIVIAAQLIRIERPGGACREEEESPDAEPGEGGKGWREVLPVLGLMALMGLYIVAMPWIGFDVATFAFVSATLLLQGERRPMTVVVIPLLFTALVVYGFKTMLWLPIPTLFG